MTNPAYQGNRCGFIPGVYRQPNIPECSTRPKFIRAVQKRIREGRFTFKARAERDEALRAVLITILDHTCLAEGGIGYADQRGRGWYSYSWDQIHNRITWLSKTRFWECIRQLKSAGFLVSEQRLTHPNQRKIFKARTSASNYVVSHKMLTAKFWAACGVTRAWQQQAAAKRSRMAEVASKLGITMATLFRIRLCNPPATANKPETIISSRESFSHLHCHLIPRLASLRPGSKDIEGLAQTLIRRYGGAILDDAVLNQALLEIH